MKYLIFSLLLLGCNDSDDIRNIKERVTTIEQYITRQQLQELASRCKKLGGEIQARDLCMIEIKGKRIWLAEGQY